MVIFDEEFGEIKLHLDEIIKKKGISKTKLAYKAEIQRTQLNNYCNDKIQRVDLAVLSRLCYVLDCTPGDLIEYIPPEKD